MNGFPRENDGVRRSWNRPIVAAYRSAHNLGEARSHDPIDRADLVVRPSDLPVEPLCNGVADPQPGPRGGHLPGASVFDMHGGTSDGRVRPPVINGRDVAGSRIMAGANGDRNLLFGLLALQMASSAAQLVAAFNAWARDKARPLAGSSSTQGDLDDEPARPARGAGRASTSSSTAATPSRAWPPSARSAARPARTSAQIGDPDLQASLARPRLDRERERRPRPHADLAVGTATAGASGSASSGRTPGAGWARSSSPCDEELHREVALKEIQDQHADDPRSRPRFLLEAEITGGLEHPGIVPVYGLGTLRRRPAVLRHAVHPGRQPQGGHRALPRRRRPGARPGPAGAGAAQAAAAGSSTSATRWPTPTAGACCTATSSRATSCSARYGETLVVDWGLAKVDRAGPGAGGSRPSATLPPGVGRRRRRDAAGLGARHAGVHEPGAGRGRARPARPGQRRLQPGGDALLPADRPGRPFEGADVERAPGRVQRGDVPAAPASRTRRSTRRWRRSA